MHAGGHQTRSQRRDVARLGLLRFGERLKMRLETVHDETFSRSTMSRHSPGSKVPVTICRAPVTGAMDPSSNRRRGTSADSSKYLVARYPCKAAVFHVADELVAAPRLWEPVVPDVYMIRRIVRETINSLRKCIVADGFAGFQRGCSRHNAVRIDLVRNHDAFQFWKIRIIDAVARRR